MYKRMSTRNKKKRVENDCDRVEDGKKNTFLKITCPYRDGKEQQEKTKAVLK